MDSLTSPLFRDKATSTLSTGVIDEIVLPPPSIICVRKSNGRMHGGRCRAAVHVWQLYARQPGIALYKAVSEGQRGTVLYTVSSKLKSAAQGRTQPALMEQVLPMRA
ncbi:hypothetical protein ACV229_01120 [Burkholderia sp. MR1-5-21]